MEFVGGLLLLVGLLTRFVAVPHDGNHGGGHRLGQVGRRRFARDPAGYEEVSYFVMFAWLGIAGPGPVSLDHFVLKAFRKDRPPSDYGA